MSEEAVFLDAIRRKPDDTVTRLVYADWLDEQGGKANAAKSAFLRYQCAFAAQEATAKIGHTKKKRLRRLANSIADPAWLTVVSMPAIERCELGFAFQCPKKWDKLTTTSDDAVRYCDACERNVYYCHTVHEALGHAVSGHCVAVNLARRRRKGDLEDSEFELSIGEVAAEDEYDAEEVDEGNLMTGELELGEIAIDDE